ncbi:membrane protein [Actinoplanes lobatus]|uniref:Membrane protein n=1 Tax=Actinoplanes lobatus TaxID=113568 RepID=A0A7W7HPA5_9ACTN|nr:hypothetical protein [Actinoplanes lobatus]MBB4754191.1 hypothetical protein [Actinoplanes lobatus]GGN77371.1 membrane protein [Actinoplanes lobatus]GIE40755.1 membrane protein [Actinoplanes lobatus]
MTNTEPLQAENYAPAGRRQPTGWVGMVVFAGVMMLMLGSFQAIEGIVALFREDFFLTTSNGLVVPVNFSTYGWTHIVIGLIAVGTGLGLLAGQMWARVVGVIIAGLSALANLAFLPAYPVWCSIVIALDVLVIYALTVHGREVKY